MGRLHHHELPGRSDGSMACKEIVTTFGDFWVTSEFHSDFMGMPYQGRSILGYDEMQGKYVGTWIDTMSGFMAIMEGEYDAANDALVMNWMAPDMTGQLAPHRSVTKNRGDQSTMTFFTSGEQTMVISMTRK